MMQPIDLVYIYPKVVVFCDGDTDLTAIMDAYKPHGFWEFVFFAVRDFKQISDWVGEQYRQHFLRVQRGGMEKEYLMLVLDAGEMSEIEAIHSVEKIGEAFCLVRLDDEIPQFENKRAVPIYTIKDDEIAAWVGDTRKAEAAPPRSP